MLLKQLAFGLSAFFLVTACGSSPAPSRGDVQSSTTLETAMQKRFQGLDAETMMKALTKGGVPDSTGLIGAINLEADEILCTTYVLPEGVPDCTIDADGKKSKIPADEAKALLALLYKLEAFTPGPLGVNKIWVHDVRCAQSVYPHKSMASCQLIVGPAA